MEQVAIYANVEVGLSTGKILVTKVFQVIALKKIALINQKLEPMCRRTVQPIVVGI